MSSVAAVGVVEHWLDEALPIRRPPLNTPPETVGGVSDEIRLVEKKLLEAERHFLDSKFIKAKEVQRTFRFLASAWRRETKLSSSLDVITESPSYRAIIDMGYDVLPLILEELEREPDYWFEALRRITGADPVPEEKRGDLNAMARAWIQWGRQRQTKF